MNPVIYAHSIIEVMPLIAQVKDRLKALNDALCNTPDPKLHISKQRTMTPVDWHMRFIEVDRAFKALERKLVGDRNVSPTPFRWPMPPMQATNTQQLSTSGPIPPMQATNTQQLPTSGPMPPPMQATYTEQLLEPAVLTEEELAQAMDFENMLGTWTTLNDPDTESRFMK
jgi:hypothetical protein